MTAAEFRRAEERRAANELRAYRREEALAARLAKVRNTTFFSLFALEASTSRGFDMMIATTVCVFCPTLPSPPRHSSSSTSAHQALEDEAQRHSSIDRLRENEIRSKNAAAANADASQSQSRDRQLSNMMRADMLKAQRVLRDRADKELDYAENQRHQAALRNQVRQVCPRSHSRRLDACTPHPGAIRV